ncbi:MAG: hypothetical protein HY461_01755 [Parcubacteria group bacterium]|nr:hypothetical protein [Parcubacteria group bacterium]
MGTPKQLNKFSVREMCDALLLAKETAMDFRSLDARVKALERLRVLLLPMVEWLDKPIKECFPNPREKTSNASTKRALPFFRGFRTFPPVALARKGDWVTLNYGFCTSDEEPVRAESVSSAWLASAISRSRHAILEAIPWGHKKESLVAMESVGMGDIVEHCAFLKYLALGMDKFDEVLKEREERLCTMRHNFSLLKSFVSGIDPFEYGAPKSSLPGYALFNRHPRGVSRSSGTYFISVPVEREAEERNKKRASGSDYEYYVYEDGCHRFDRLEYFLSCVRYSIEEIPRSRDPLSDEEIKVLTDFADGIGVPQK